MESTSEGSGEEKRNMKGTCYFLLLVTCFSCVMDLIDVQGLRMYDYYEVFYFVRSIFIDLDYDYLIYIMTFEAIVLK